MDNNKKLKGFTLVELIVVIAIIGVLASIASIGTAAYVKNSTIKTNQGEARMGLAAIQNCVTNWEINPATMEAILVDPNTMESINSSGGPSAPKVGAVVLSFYIQDGYIAHYDRASRTISTSMPAHDIFVRHGATPAAAVAVTNPYKLEAATGLYQKEYSILARQIQDSFGSGATGRFDAYLTLEYIDGSKDLSYVVDRVVYSPRKNGITSNDTLLRIKPKAFYTNRFDHRADLSAANGSYGSYPYTDEIESIFET